MFRKTLTTLASAAVLAAAITSPSFAGMGGGGENPNDGRPSATAYSSSGSITARGNRDGSRTVIHRDRGGKVIKKVKIPKAPKKPKKPKNRGQAWASSTDPVTGNTITVRQKANGGRVVTERDARGNVIRRDVIGNPPRGGGAGNPPAPRPRGRAWASAYDPDTGTRTTAIDNGNRTRTVITIGPFGFGVHTSR